MNKENQKMSVYDVRSWNVGKVIKNPSDDELRKLAKHDEQTTEFGSASYVTKIRSRSAQFTRSSVDKEILPEDLKYIEDLSQNVNRYELIQLDRQVGQGEYAFHVRLYVTKEYARLAYELSRSLVAYREPDHTPDFITLDIPEWNTAERRMLVFADKGITFLLGSDYWGEIKKSFLRQAMYRMKQKGGLGLHAGAKEVTYSKNGEKYTEGLLLFGLSGTGKTSLTCHDFGFGKDTVIKQDDVVLLSGEGKCYGTEERGFYIKTDGLTQKEQPLLYKAASHPHTVFENVWVEKNGKVDFFSDKLTSNGRAVVPVSEIDHTSPDNIHCDNVHRLFYITRNPLMPPIAKLTLTLGAAYFMLGESIKTSAADPKAKGEPVREVGTNPFIMGPKGEEGNRIYELAEKLGFEFYVVNTGFLGPNKNKKVKLDDTVFFFRNTLLGNIEWEKDPDFGFEIPAKVLGKTMDEWRVKKYFTEEEYVQAVSGLKKDREKWFAQFPELRSEILNAIH
ncbi:MAG: phosphoenolpyruvate carboxykinase [Deltaproteobacteria bacterium]|nr:phosphoenolpyruvate carboxykinase [Deltaproteobacteria bacterium]